MRPARRFRFRWLLPALLACILSCQTRESEPALDGLEARTVTGRVRIFLIAPNGAGAGGREVGCGDSAVPTVVTLPRPLPALEGALQALLDLRGNRHSPATGLYNALYASPLAVERIERLDPNGAEVRVHLKGYLEVEDACDGSRVLAQLTETALQFPDVSRAQFLLAGRPLSGLLPRAKR